MRPPSLIQPPPSLRPADSLLYRSDLTINRGLRRSARDHRRMLYESSLAARIAPSRMEGGLANSEYAANVRDT